MKRRMTAQRAKSPFVIVLLLALQFSAIARVPLRPVDKPRLNRTKLKITSLWGPAGACATVVGFELLRRRRSKNDR